MQYVLMRYVLMQDGCMHAVFMHAVLLLHYAVCVDMCVLIYACWYICVHTYALAHMC